MKRLVLLLSTLIGLGLAACAAPQTTVIQPMLISAPIIAARPSVTPLPTAQPPDRFIRPPGSPTPTGFLILSGPTLDPETLAAFNVTLASATPTAVLAESNPVATPTAVVALNAPSATPTAVLAAASPTGTPSAQVAFNASATPTRIVVLANPTLARPTPTATQVAARPSPTAAPSAIQPSATVTRVVAQPSPTPTPTRVVAFTTPTAPASWQFQRGRITAPVLLYHRIQAPPDPARQSPRYTVPPEAFEAQLKAFKEWGYTSITISQLSNAIMNGAPLPPRPIIFTFDDGYISVYQNAFPLMQKYGFVGVFYVLGQNFSDPDFVNADQLREMAAAGWEIGSHSMTHSHLPQNHETLNLEVVESKRRLEAFIGVPIQSFAYPFGEFDEKVVNKVAAYYTSAVALGLLYENGPGNIYAIRRIEIRYEYSLEDIAATLPWSSPP